MMENRIFRLARAKINLDLLLYGRRNDGYHLLDSLVVFANYGDEISVYPANKVTLKITGPFAADLIGTNNIINNEDNIILKAARLLQQTFNISDGADIRLAKRLPVASGIGGGSADAAASLHALGALWNIPAKTVEMATIAISLGADLPVCMASKTMRMSGAGEILHPVTITFPVHLLLVNPAVSVVTKDIFKARGQRGACFSPARNLPEIITTLAQLRNILVASGNDLQYDACAMVPEIKTTLKKIEEADDCVFSAMSGSGATCFGLFPTREAAKGAAVSISRCFPHWWVQSTKIS